MRIRPLIESDLSLVRTWMQEVPEAPAWSDDDLLRLLKVAYGDERKTRRAWVAEDESELAGFAVATSLTLPDAPSECELELVLVPYLPGRTSPGQRSCGWRCDIPMSVRSGFTRDAGSSSKDGVRAIMLIRLRMRC
jgi:hypothetical protein